MKVVYIIPATAMGGLERLFYNCLEIRDMFPGVEFASVYAYAGRPENHLLKAQGVKFFFEIHVVRWKNLLYYHHASFFRILRFIRKHRIRIFHAQDTFTMLYGLGAKLILGTKLVRSHHGSENQYWASDNLFFRLTRRWVDMNIFVSASYLHTFCRNNRISPARVPHRIIHNGILAPVANQSVRRSADNGIRMIMVGNYYGGRDHLFAIRLVEKLLLAGQNVSLVLIGNPARDDTAKYDTCVKYVQDHKLENRVEFLRSVTDVWPHLRGADLFVYQSTRDTFGIAIVEAMLCGLPCLVNDLDVFVEISRGGELCTLYKTSDLDDCYNKALDIIYNYPAYRAKAEQQIATVNDLYSMQGYARNVMKVYQEVLERG
jgi:glycosyltransferase involved in cell wall biosynthesis